MSDDVATIAGVTVNAARSVGRRPRAIVQLNGSTVPSAIPGSNGAIVVPGWISWEVSSHTYFEASTFRVSFAASGLPQDHNAAWFATQREAYVRIFAGFPADPENPKTSELMSLIYGRVDDIEYDPAQRIINLSGRDLTAAFIDSRITDDWSNQTASAIVEARAAAHGLGSVVQRTFTKVGTYYEIDQIKLLSNRSEWDLLALIAREEGFVCYVQDQTLYFQPDPSLTADPYLIQWTAPRDPSESPTAFVQEITFSRSLTVAKGITVEVRSPSLDKKTATVAYYPSAPKSIQAGKATPFGAVQPFYYKRPAGWSQVQCQQYAQQKYDEIISHEMKMVVKMPADNDLTIQTPIKVTGTGTGFDQVYFPHAVTREMSLDEGYHMTAEAQNVSPDSSPAL